MAKKQTAKAPKEKDQELIEEPKAPKEKVPKAPKEKVPKAPKEKVPKAPKEKVPKVPKEKVPKTPKEKVPKVPKEKVPKALGGAGAKPTEAKTSANAPAKPPIIKSDDDIITNKLFKLNERANQLRASQKDFDTNYGEILEELKTIIEKEKNIFDLVLNINTENKKAKEYIISVIIDKIKKLTSSKNEEDKYKKKALLIYLINNIIYAITLINRDNKDNCKLVDNIFRFRYIKIKKDDVDYTYIDKNKNIIISNQNGTNAHFKDAKESNYPIISIYLNINTLIYGLEYKVLKKLYDDINIKKDGNDEEIKKELELELGKIDEDIVKLQTNVNIDGKVGYAETTKGTYEMFYKFYYWLSKYLQYCFKNKISELNKILEEDTDIKKLLPIFDDKIANLIQKSGEEEKIKLDKAIEIIKKENEKENREEVNLSSFKTSINEAIEIYRRGVTIFSKKWLTGFKQNLELLIGGGDRDNLSIFFQEELKFKKYLPKINEIYNKAKGEIKTLIENNIYAKIDDNIPLTNQYQYEIIRILLENLKQIKEIVNRAKEDAIIMDNIITQGQLIENYKNTIDSTVKKTKRRVVDFENNITNAEETIKKLRELQDKDEISEQLNNNLSTEIRAAIDTVKKKVEEAKEIIEGKNEDIIKKNQQFDDALKDSKLNDDKVNELADVSNGIVVEWDGIISSFTDDVNKMNNAVKEANKVIDDISNKKSAAKKQAASQRAEEEAQRVRAEAQRAEEEAQRVRAEEEAQRVRAEEEAQRVRAEAQRAQEEAQRLAAQRVQAEEEAQRAQEEAQRVQAEEEAQRVQAEAQRAQEEAQRLAAQRAQEEAQRVQAEAQRAQEEAQRLAAQRVQAEAQRAQEEAQRLAAQRLAAQRVQAEAQRLEAARRLAETTAATAQKQAEDYEDDFEKEDEGDLSIQSKDIPENIQPIETVQPNKLPLDSQLLYFKSDGKPPQRPVIEKDKSEIENIPEDINAEDNSLVKTQVIAQQAPTEIPTVIAQPVPTEEETQRAVAVETQKLATEQKRIYPSLLSTAAVAAAAPSEEVKYNERIYPSLLSTAAVAAAAPSEEVKYNERIYPSLPSTLLNSSPPLRRRDSSPPRLIGEDKSDTDIPDTREVPTGPTGPTGPAIIAQPNKSRKNEYDNLDEATLKARYLYTQKYKNIDNHDLKDIRGRYNELHNQPKQPDINNKISRLSADIDIYNGNENGDDDSDDGGGDGNSRDRYEDIKNKINRFDNDPNNPIEALEIRFEDRLVFIIVTFFIRYAVISIIQRGIDINIIKTFYEGFIYYGTIYIIFFWFIVLFINIDNNYTIEYINVNNILNYIRSLFYYFFMGTNGISRLIIHSLLILIIIIIPIILNIKNTKAKDAINDDEEDKTKLEPLSLEERTNLSKTLSLFTLLIWVLTSLIATKF